MIAIHPIFIYIFFIKIAFFLILGPKIYVVIIIETNIHSFDLKAFITIVSTDILKKIGILTKISDNFFFLKKFATKILFVKFLLNLFLLFENMFWINFFCNVCFELIFYKICFELIFYKICFWINFFVKWFVLKLYCVKFVLNQFLFKICFELIFYKIRFWINFFLNLFWINFL